MGNDAYIPWYGEADPSHGRMRASDRDRDRTVDVIQTAFAEGRLTKDEYDERLEQVFAARTYGELARLTDDLPVAPRAVPLPDTAGAGIPAAQQTNALAVASLVLGLVGMSVPAVICGHVARHQIRRSGEAGAGLAVAGLVLGWAELIFLLLAIIGIAAVVSTHGVHHVPGPGP